MGDAGGGATGSRCESCGMLVPIGPWCDQCTDSAGNLQPLQARIEDMCRFMMGRDPSLTRAAALEATRRYLAGMPAWAGRPELEL